MFCEFFLEWKRKEKEFFFSISRLSGLSPFMGDNDIETYANINRVIYDFDDEAFANISDGAKDFISKLLVKEKR